MRKAAATLGRVARVLTVPGPAQTTSIQRWRCRQRSFSAKPCYLAAAAAMPVATESIPDPQQQRQQHTVITTYTTTGGAEEDQQASQDAEERFQAEVSRHPAAIEFKSRRSSSSSSSSNNNINTCNTPDRVVLTRSALVPREKDHVENNLTCSTLHGPGRIFPRPLVYTDVEAGALVAFYRLGRRLAGHNGIVHGGVSAALLDECMCRASFPRMPHNISVTARLELDYKCPIPVDSFVVVRADTTRVEGRKAWVKASIEDAVDGRVFVEAEGLFVEPKWAASMTPIY